ncbi:MAG TPA: hypothetical protein VEB23_03885 [Ramlibacter sp.]|nr:hypothetical protein [Ramlibacter sp.]
MPTVLSRAVRSLAPVLAGVPEAHAELLALIWDARFDRAEALRLAAGLPGAAGPLQAAADRFDALALRQQQRLRRLGAQWPRRSVRDNEACPASC